MYERKKAPAPAGPFCGASPCSYSSFLFVVERQIIPHVEGAEAKFLPTSAIGAVLTSVNTASGNWCQTARSSSVIVSQPNLYMYRPGSVTRPTRGHVILSTTVIPPVAPLKFRRRSIEAGANLMRQSSAQD